MEAIDETIEHKHKVDQTLARFSAVHDEIEQEERKRRERKARFMRWRGTDEAMETALSSSVNLAPVAKPEDDTGAVNGRRDEPPKEPPTRLQEKKHRKRRRSAITGKIMVILLAALVFAGTGVAWGAKTWLNGKLRHTDALDGGSSSVRNAAGQLGDENFLLVGSDTRIGQSANDNAGTAANVHGARADTIMVAHLPANRARVVVVSFPRDLEVTRPACQQWDPKTDHYGDQQTPPAQHVKLNSVYADGGPKCLDKVIKQLSGLKINHFAGINFGGFKNMVDAVHGVKVCSTVPIVDSELGVVLPRAGPQVISGTQALNYVRARHVRGDPTSDYGRIKRQQRFLSSLLRKVLSSNVLLSPSKLDAFVNAFADSTTTDNLGIDQLITLAQSMRGVTSGKVTFVTVPTTGYANSRGNEVLRPAENRALFDSIINGTPLPGQHAAAPQGQASPKPSKADPKTVKIQVLNAGNPTTGIARRTAQQLAAKGFQVAMTNNARSKVGHTTIRYAADAKAKALTLAAAVPGAQLKQDPASEGAVILLLGPDFHGLDSTGTASPTSPKKQQPKGPPLSVIHANDTSCPSL